MKTKLKCILAATILSASTSSLAKDISYDYIQGTYALLTINHSEGDIDGNTFGANGSTLALHQTSLYLQASG